MFDELFVFPGRFQDNQCGIVTNIDIECAVKLVGTNCVLYPVNSKDLQHIWVRSFAPDLTPSVSRPRERDTRTPHSHPAELFHNEIGP